MSIVELDEKQLVVFADLEAAIGGLAEQYLPLKIAGPDDKKGYEAVYAARQDVKKRRVKVEHLRKDLKANALEFGRKVDNAAKKLEGLLTPIERHLQEQEDGYEASREAIRRKAAEEKKAKLQARIDAVQAVGAVVSIAVLEALTDEQFNAELATATKAYEERKAAEERDRLEREKKRADEEARQARLQARINLMVVYEGVSSIQALGEMTDEQFGAELDAAKARYKKRQDDKAEADRLQKAEEDRLAAERAKLDSDKKAQDDAAKAEADRLAEQQRTLDEERRKLDAEKQRLDREEFDRHAKLKAEQEARDKLEAERKEQERLAKEKAERDAAEEARKEAMKPDLEKLRDYVVALEAVPIPSVSDPAVYQIVLNMTGEVERMCQRVESWIDEQAK